MNALRRYHQSLRARSYSGLDLLIILMSFVVCHYLYLGGLEFSPERIVIVVAALGLTYIAFAAAGLYKTSRTLLLHSILNRMTVGWFLVVTSVALLAFLTKIAGDVSRVWFGLSTILAYLGLIGARVASAVVMMVSQKHGTTRVSVVVVGDEGRTDDLVDRLTVSGWSGYDLAKAFRLKGSLDLDAEARTDVTRVLNELTAFVESRRQASEPVAEVWIALPLAQEACIKDIIARLRNSSVDVCVVPDAFGMQLVTGAAMNIADVAVINISDIRLPGSAELFKRLFDWVVALLAVLMLAPVLLAIAMAVKLESRGPVLFRQHRYGIDGKEIEVWKFRSMSVQENRGAVVQATRNDARVTRIGAILRKHSLDELPQFVNVLQGSMSIVGPRPHAVSHNEEYRAKIDGYMMRHKIKPGITGWAQVNGWRGETDTLEKMEGRVRYDLEYIRNWSPWLDLKIILLTVAHVVSGKDAY